MTQTMAILRYLGNKYGLALETLEEKRRADLVAEQLLDLRNGFVRMCYADNHVRRMSKRTVMRRYHMVSSRSVNDLIVLL